MSIPISREDLDNLKMDTSLAFLQSSPLFNQNITKPLDQYRIKFVKNQGLSAGLVLETKKEKIVKNANTARNV
jgi:hypothetical protein